MPYREVAGLLTDLGTEEMAHYEMVATIVHQLTRNLTPEEIKESGFGDYYIDHTLGIWPQAAGGVPQNACEFQVKGDPITDIMEDMAAEQKARSTYDNILRVVKDPDVIDPIRFLRAREVVHFQRFGEANREHCRNGTVYKIQDFRITSSGIRTICEISAVPSSISVIVWAHLIPITSSLSSIELIWGVVIFA